VDFMHHARSMFIFSLPSAIYSPQPIDFNSDFGSGIKAA
jgi:hypothetical protein